MNNSDLLSIFLFFLFLVIIGVFILFIRDFFVKGGRIPISDLLNKLIKLRPLDINKARKLNTTQKILVALSLPLVAFVWIWGSRCTYEYTLCHQNLNLNQRVIYSLLLVGWLTIMFFLFISTKEK